MIDTFIDEDDGRAVVSEAYELIPLVIRQMTTYEWREYDAYQAINNMQPLRTKYPPVPPTGQEQAHHPLGPSHRVQ